MALGVNALDTSRRSRVWSGGSRLRIVFAPPRRSRRRIAIWSFSSMRALASTSRLKALLRSTRATSSYRLTTSGPPGT